MCREREEEKRARTESKSVEEKGVLCLIIFFSLRSTEVLNKLRILLKKERGEITEEEAWQQLLKFEPTDTDT